MDVPQILFVALGVAVVIGVVMIGSQQRRRMRAEAGESFGERTLVGMRVVSPTIRPDAEIPGRHARDGGDRSPSLSWDGVPEEAKELALICDDPDAPTDRPFVHWVLFGLDPHLRRLSEATEKGVEGVNDFGETGYGGPQPPVGHGRHHYHFRLYALDRQLDLKRGADRHTVEEAMRGHVIAAGQLVGTYERQAS